MASNLRRAARYPVSIPVVCDTGQQVLTGFITELSLTGASIRLGRMLPAGMLVTIVLDLRGESPLPSHIRAEIRRLDQSGGTDIAGLAASMGCRFVGLTDAEDDGIRQYLTQLGSSSRDGDDGQRR
jgi:hypothetical protein